MEIGYWLSSEEHDPRALVQHAARAEEVGFRSAMISDHFHPWIRQQGDASFVWSVIGAIARATRTLRLGTGVTAPILRMHPAIVAHAAATSAVLLEGRFLLGLGSGERLNEHVSGARWPGATERRAMLAEAVELIRALLKGNNVNYRGEFYRVENAQLFTLPVGRIPIVIAVGDPESATLAGRIADGMLAVSPDPQLLEAFEHAGGRNTPRLGQLHICWAETADAARKTVVDCWPNAAIRGPALSDLARPNDFEKVLEQIPSDAIVADVVCGPDVDVHVAAIGRFAAAGFTEVYVHQIGPDQEGFSASIPTTSSHVSPEIAWINIDHPPSHTPHQRDIASP